jgi:orotate phosphoribosyltransferase
MSEDILKRLPARQGHFRLESGYHTDLWLTLDALFTSPRSLAPLIETLADRLRPHNVTAVSDPFLGGAFLAQALATSLGVEFYFSEPVSKIWSMARVDVTDVEGLYKNLQ